MVRYVEDPAMAKVVSEMPYGYKVGTAELPRIGYRIRALFEMVYLDEHGNEVLNAENRPDSLIGNSVEALVSNWAVTVVHAGQTTDAEQPEEQPEPKEQPE